MYWYLDIFIAQSFAIAWVINAAALLIVIVKFKLRFTKEWLIYTFHFYVIVEAFIVNHGLMLDCYEFANVYKAFF